MAAHHINKHIVGAVLDKGLAGDIGRDVIALLYSANIPQVVKEEDHIGVLPLHLCKNARINPIGRYSAQEEIIGRQDSAVAGVETRGVDGVVELRELNVLRVVVGVARETAAKEIVALEAQTPRLTKF